ncbi:MAG: periplasmic heavy metal sensor, partial [Acidobacteria bacterium]|nr:periplasmic heavy metal sensor [Acidobacteriota bacterium]
MRLSSKVMIAAIALATPMFVAAQQAPPPPGAGMGPGMGLQQRMGPRVGQQMGPRMGMRGQRGMQMRQRFLRQHPGIAMHGLMQNPAMRERLKITPDQLAKFQAHESAMAKTMIRSRADIQVKRLELAELMRADKPDRVLIDKKLREVQDATFAQEKARIDGQLSVRDMFTPEQRQEMEKIREEFRSPGMQRGPGPGGMMGP